MGRRGPPNDAESLGEVEAQRRGSGLSGHPTLYVIRNGKIGAEPKITNANLAAIAARSLATLTKAQGAGNLLTGYKLVNASGGTCRATWIRDDFTDRPDKLFDPDCMQALFAYGHRRFRQDDLWAARPPLVEAIQSVEFARRLTGQRFAPAIRPRAA